VGAVKKGVITVAVLNGLDITVYRYLWLPLVTNIAISDMPIYKYGHIILDKSVPIYPQPIYPYYKWGYRSGYIGYGFFNHLVLP
jgi:hypothetical protein